MSRDSKTGRSAPTAAPQPGVALSVRRLSSPLARGATVLALGSALLLAGCFGESAQDLVKSARDHLDKKDTKAAIIQLKNALQKDGSLGEARFLLAKALLDAGDLPGAVIEADKAKAQGYNSEALTALQARLLLLQGKPEDVVAQYATRHLSTPADEADLQSTLVGAFVAKRQMPEARTAADAALKAAPDSAAVQLMNIRLMTSEGKLKDALVQLDALLAKSPNLAEGWQVKGDLQELAEAPVDERIDSYRKALAIDKKLPGAHSGLISALMRKGDKAAAKEAVAAMKAALPTHAQTFYYASIFALDAGNLKEATDLSQALLKIAPGNDRALYLAGRVAQANGDLRQAESNFAKVVSTSPEAPQARIALAQVQLRGGDVDQAWTTLQPALDGKPGPTGEALALAAEIKLKQGQGDQAESLLARAAALNPADITSRVGLALTQAKKGQEAQAVEALRKLTVEDKGITADLALVSLYLRKKDWAKANEVIDGIERKQPESGAAPELRGRVALFRGDRAAARAQFEQAIKREPKALSPANNLASMDLQDKKPEDAAKRYDAAIKADPKNLKAIMAQIGVRVTHQLVTPDDAIKQLNEIARNFPSEPAPRLALVSLLVNKQDLKQAAAVAQEGITANPDSAELLDALGQVQQAQGERQSAITSFNKLVSVQPRSPVGQLRLADLYIASGQPADRELAATALKRAQAIGPGDAELAEKVAGKALSIGHPDVALVAAKGLQAARPTFGLGWKLEGDVARARKDWTGALAAYRKADQLSKDAGASVPNTALAVALHGVLVESGKTEEAKQYAATWLSQHKQDTLFRYHLGDVALTKGQYDQAEQYYQGVLADSPENAAAANNIAWLKLRTGRNDEGLKYAEKANQMRPKVAPYMDTWAEALAAKGQTDKAIEVQQQVVQQAPGVPAYRLRLAQLYVAGGKKAEAQTELKRLADLGPQFEQQAEVQKLQAAIR
ncbi:putative PEP-CTERM system TPR-repeat lipoprotein [Roseateles sp. YR242]|uniref:XrtA/PEP-CTERM system TPR-repeat protein PrsT n=1 Tax=Roseateles sp. YR242 TaxID=1855305 RepID=UPI0008D6C089|nr:XrtA/PEP-CTERM system TPR-repeat protein PrsT [Roseateles sp. YR242]SEL10207.1 putative PEP-CTERM system TPR-repeat lipoprotein [Roseateles sp. YR242]